MKFANTEIFNIEGAIRGMRNPLNSWSKSDSRWGYSDEFHQVMYILGKNDLTLAQKLILAGDEHGKFLRQIFISVDITAPLYVYKEFDTYKIGTVANSTSSMHTLTSKPITKECFEIDDLNKDLPIDIPDSWYKVEDLYTDIIQSLEFLRLKYLETKDMRYWKELIRWLPESWLQTRTWTANYAVLRNIYKQRCNHKLSEWHTICNWIDSLPYAKELITI